MNPFRAFVDLALELRKRILLRYATGNPYTQEEAAALAARLKALAADCRVAARRMGCAGGEGAVDTLLHAVVELFNAPARQREPYSRANNLAAAVPPVARLADDFDAESRSRGTQEATAPVIGTLAEAAGASEGGGGGRPADPLPGNQGKKVNARMLEKMQKDAADGSKECYGWTRARWARFLKCSTPSVVAAPAWKMLREARETAKAERARDRRRRPKGSDQRRAAGQV
jgi:hypothetical protein